MSGICGIYNRNNQPVDPDLLSTMTGAISHRGPDGSGQWIDGPVGFAHQMLWTTPESLHENQPFWDETRRLCLTFDGRIDNRKELKDSLKTHGIDLFTDTDAEIVLAAYACWGVTCPERILGDFAFAIWDPPQNRLFCARDILGMKPFYYCLIQDRFMFASELQQILKDPTVPREPNEGMVAEYLVSAVRNKNETLYQDILRLPPAHHLIVTPDQIQMKRYWDLDPDKEIRYRSDDDYAAHFLETFKEAISCRMRTNKRTGCQLSGGLDSSSIACVAQSLIQNGDISKNGFETFSMVFPGWRCDESKYINAVNQKWKIKSNPLNPIPPGKPWYEKQVHRYLDIPDYPTGSISDGMERLAQEKGFRVLLTGLGGDEWFTGSYYHHADLLKQFKFLSLAREAKHEFGRDALKLQSANPIFKHALKPFIPVHIKQGIKRLLSPKQNGPVWLNPAFVRAVNLTERINGQIDWRRFSSFAQADQYTCSTRGFQTHGIEMEERSASSFGLELRHPFHDRRLLEFGMSIPETQRMHSNQQKRIIRRAMKKYLPESVLFRHTKSEYSRVFVYALQMLGGQRLFDSLSIAAAGWVNQNAIRSIYEEMSQPGIENHQEVYENVWPLWHVFGIELWFNHVFGSP